MYSNESIDMLVCDILDYLEAISTHVSHAFALFDLMASLCSYMITCMHPLCVKEVGDLIHSLVSYFINLELISSILVLISSHYIILDLITTLKRFHIIGSELFYMVLVSILQLFLIQVSRFFFFPRRIFL